MKTIVAISDNHHVLIPDSVLAIINEADYFFYLGDGVRTVLPFDGRDNFFAVRGNNDPALYPDEQLVETEGIKILLTHGHNFSVRSGLIKLKLRAEELGASVVFFGHTHFADVQTADGITFVNVGALAYPFNGIPSYVYATVACGKFIAKIVNLK